MDVTKKEIPISWWHYIVPTIPYTVFFIGILFIFDGLMRIARLFSYRAFRRIEYWMCRMIRWNMCVTAGAEVKVQYTSGQEVLCLAKPAPLIVVSNHQSMYDVSLLDELFNAYEPRFISKKELAAWVPAVSFISRNNKTVLIDRKDRAQALRAMKEGALLTVEDTAAICIFPEGTRAKDGKLQPFKTAGLQTLMNAMPEAWIVPVTIDGSWQILRYNFFPIPWGARITITVADPVPVDLKNAAEQIKSIEQLIHSTLQYSSENQKLGVS